MTFQKKKRCLVFHFVLSPVPLSDSCRCCWTPEKYHKLRFLNSRESPILYNDITAFLPLWWRFHHRPCNIWQCWWLWWWQRPLWWQFHHRPCNMWQCWWLWWWQRPLWWQFHPRPCPWTWTVSPGASPPPWTQRRRACRQSFFIQLRSISFNCLDSSRKMWDKNCTCPISFFIQ